MTLASHNLRVKGRARADRARFGFPENPIPGPGPWRWAPSAIMRISA